MTNVFVGDLSYFCTDADLVELFTPVGPVKSTMIMRIPEGDSRHYGFVEMTHELDAEKAIETLNGIEFMGRVIRVCSYETGLKSKPPRSNSNVKVRVSFLSSKAEPQINEIFLSSFFGAKFGPVIDCLMVRYSVCHHPTQRQSGYGFVFFQKLADAVKAAKTLTGKQSSSCINGICFDCQLSSETARMSESPEVHKPSSRNDSPESTSSRDKSIAVDSATMDYAQSSLSRANYSKGMENSNARPNLPTKAFEDEHTTGCYVDQTSPIFMTPPISYSSHGVGVIAYPVPTYRHQHPAQSAYSTGSPPTVSGAYMVAVPPPLYQPMYLPPQCNNPQLSLLPIFTPLPGAQVQQLPYPPDTPIMMPQVHHYPYPTSYGHVPPPPQCASYPVAYASSPNPFHHATQHQQHQSYQLGKPPSPPNPPANRSEK